MVYEYQKVFEVTFRNGRLYGPVGLGLALWNTFPWCCRVQLLPRVLWQAP